MRNLIEITVLMFGLAWPAFCGDCDHPFDVSLFSSRAVDLSPYYQAAVREATEMYRGDLDGLMIVRLDFPPLRVPSEFQHGFNPFPSEPFTLRGSIRDEDQMRAP